MRDERPADGVPQSGVTTIRRALLLRFAALIVFAFVVFAAGLHFLVVTPATHEIAAGEMARVTGEVESEFNGLVGQTERVLRTVREYGASGELDLFDLATFNRLFTPVLRNRAVATAIHVTDGTGRQVLLEKLADGDWVNRLRDPGKWGKKRRQLNWKDAGGPAVESWHDEDYDALKRSWYVGAMGLERDRDVYWSEPYRFAGTEEPGITAAMKWKNARGEIFVIAIDIRLLVLSRFIATLKAGEHGRPAILTNDGILVGVSSPDIQGDDAIRKAVLRTPAEAGAQKTARAFELWKEESRPYDVVHRFDSDGEAWLSRFHSTPYGKGHVIVAVVAPESDFLPAAARRAAGLFGLLLAAVIAVGLVSAAVAARRFSVPLESLAAESRRLAEMKLDEPIATRSNLREVATLVDGQERMRVALKDAMAELEASNRELEARVNARTRELSEREAYFRAIFENTGVGIITRDGSRKLIGVNSAYLNFLGYTREEIRDLPASAFLSAEEQARTRDALAKIESGGLPFYAVEREYRRKDGSLRWAHVVTSAIRSEDGTFLATVTVVNDITERRQAESRIATARAQLQAIVDGTSALVFMKDLEGRYLMVSRPFTDFFGWIPEKVIGRTDPELLPPEVAAAFQAADRRALAAGREIQLEERAADTSGQVHSFMTSKFPLFDAEGKMYAMAGVATDVSERKRMEDELRSAYWKAEEATRAKSMFLASMSHEIRTPMNGVLGVLELLALTDLNPSQRESLEIVRESARSLLRIIDDILDFSKIEAGKLELRPEPTSISHVVDAVHGIYSGVASAKNLVLRKSVDPAISPALMVDALRLRQILNNFLSNGIKFTSAGHVEIRAESLGRSGESERLRFTVSDTGIGVAPEARERLFQPFVQAEGDTTKRFGGTGLGLTICRRLADMMGGTIEMESEPGKGTRMIFTVGLPVADPRDLPKADAQGAAAAALPARRKAPSVREARAEGTLVLLVDDHPTNRALLLRQLNLLGYAAESAENGREALERWREGGFAAVITDCNMPEMDGYDLARQIRESESRGGMKRTPVIACTANALAGEAEVCLKAGMDDFVAKPVGIDALAKVMDRWLPLGGASDGVVAPASRGETNASGSALDRASLAQLTGGDAGVEREILSDFRIANDADMLALREALDRRDVEQAARTAHRMKGACRLVGAVALADVCERMEMAGKRKDWESIAGERDALEREFERLSAWLRGH